jgi:hypothetical protein
VQRTINNKPKEKNMNTKTIINTVAAVLLLTAAVHAGELVNTSGASRIALDGYDPVAFFTDHKPGHGDPGIVAEYKGAKYLFASKEHQQAFEAAPDKYVPQFGGYCAFGAALGALFPVDINTWQIRDGKLYLNLNPAILKKFNEDFDQNVAKARQNWPGLVDRHAK